MPEVTEANAAFWDELCGSDFARRLGIIENTASELARFDDAYFAFYPYLRRYLDVLPAGKTLEIGVGYGTVARLLAARADFHAVDIAAGPVEMARQALLAQGKNPGGARQASALALPFEDQTFDAVIAIGSLHHTGDLPLAVSEVRRVLRQGGVALVMVYNARSLNRLVTAPLMDGLSRLMPSRSGGLRAHALRDANIDGAPAPHTDFLTSEQARDLFSQFSSVSVRGENASHLSIRRHTLLRREWLLPVVRRVAALDLYITATR